MPATLEFIFSLSLAGVTWSGALVALVAARTAAGHPFRYGPWITGLHVLALLGGAITLSAVIGERPHVDDMQTTFPTLIKWGSIIQWTPFILGLIVLAFTEFASPARKPPPLS